MEFILALAGLALGAVGFQMGWKAPEFLGLLVAAVCLGMLLGRQGSSL